MQIEHVAIWTRDLERLKAFYEAYFGGVAGAKYTNPATQFTSYFLSFRSGARLELMQSPAVAEPPTSAAEQISGYAHLAFSVGSIKEVDALTARLRAEGVQVLDGPRWTGRIWSSLDSPLPMPSSVPRRAPWE